MANVIIVRHRDIDWALRRNEEERSRLEKERAHLLTAHKLHDGQYEQWLDRYCSLTMCGTYLAKVSSVHNTTITPYAQAWNRSFINQMQRRLPRELRDMVYEWLCDDETMDDTWDTLVLDHDTPVPCARSPCACKLSFEDIPHYFQPAYLDGVTAREIVEIMYKKAPWEYDAHTPEKIKDVLFHDLFHTGFNPVSTIKALSVTCKIDNYRTTRKCFRKDKGCKHSPADRAYVMQRTLKTSFDHLLAVPKKADFYLEVTFVQRNIRITVLEEALETLREVYTTYREAGATLVIEWQYAQSPRT
jgi:hypothetical protein